MAIKLTINLPQSAADLITGYGAGAKLYLERDTTSAFAAPTVVASPALISGTEQYEIWDTAGTDASWYRSRIGNTGGTLYSNYSAVAQPGSFSAYATLDELLRTMSVATGDTEKYSLLSDLLVDASNAIDQMCGRDFYRHPQVSGDETRYFHVRRPGQRSLTRAIGMGLDIISVTTLELASVTGGTYTAVAAGPAGYWMEPQNVAPGWPFDDVMLSDLGNTFGAYALGEQVVKLTAAFGWSAIPPLVKRATIDQAREWYRQGPGGGGPIGIGALGQPVFSAGQPSTVREVYRRFRRRDFLHV